MNLEKLREELWEGLGEDSDLDPSTVAGAIKLDGWINRAYRRILFWKFPDGRHIRFPVTNDSKMVQFPVKRGTVAASASTTITLDTNVGSDASRYVDWIVKITAGTGIGQTRSIVAYNTTRTATVSRAWTTNPAVGDSYELYKRFLHIVPSTHTYASENLALDPRTELVRVLKVMDMYDMEYLEVGHRESPDPSGWEDLGTPSSYYVHGHRIWFDLALEEERWYRVEYVSYPYELSAETDVPYLPEPFHDAILLQAKQYGLSRNQEWNGAYSVKRDLQDLMQTLLLPEDVEYEREDVNAEVL